MSEHPVLWQPPADISERCRLGDFLHWLRERGIDHADYASAYRWSVTDLAGFWQSVWDYFAVISHQPARAVLEDTGMPGTRWFPGATLNWAENVLRAPGLDANDIVVSAYSQGREDVHLTVAQLREQVRRVAAGLRRRGVGQGDRVAAYAPNIPETYILLLATASIGAVFTSCPPEFGAHSVLDRWRQVEPAFLFATAEYTYGDKTIDRRDDLDHIRESLPSLRSVVTLDEWEQLDGPEPLEFTPVPFDHPLYVLYSSGTTGLPKPIVHGHGGILLEHLKMLGLHQDLGPGDRFFWFSTTGWMMWNFLASGPAVGCAIVLFDGNPGWPSLDTLWHLAREAQITYFGTSAPFLMACRKSHVEPPALPRLRMIGSTGAPLPSEGFEWVYQTFGPDIQLQSLSGGTDVCTGFVGGAPLLPVRDGAISCRALGAKVEAFTPEGRSVTNELGELVITAPMPSMPVALWNDPDGSRYRAAYFDDFPGVWRHGDWIEIYDDGSCVISGRSDATLNRGGVRLGTAEFYAVVEDLDEVADSLVVHLESEADPSGTLLLFVALTPGCALTAELTDTITRRIRRELSPRHVPDRIIEAPGIPRTLSGKKLEVPVKRILQGADSAAAVSLGSLANPETVPFFVRGSWREG